MSLIPHEFDGLLYSQASVVEKMDVAVQLYGRKLADTHNRINSIGQEKHEWQ